MNRSKKPLIKHITDFLEYCEVEKGLSPVSTRNYHNFLKSFISWLKFSKKQNILPHQITEKDIWNYRLYLSRKKDKKQVLGYQGYIKKTTQSYYLRALRALFSYFSVRDIQAIPSNKINLPKLTDKDKKIKFLKFDQVEKLLNTPNTKTKSGLRDRSILELLYSTGMRVSELTSLNIEQFNIDKLRKKDFTDQELSIQGKGGSTRTIYFSKRSLKWLSKYVSTRKDMLPPLFINYRLNNEKDDERRLSVRAIEAMIRKYSTMAGLPVKVTPHTLRHSFATDLLNQGADLRSVQELLGHRNIATTQVYTHVTNRGLKEIHKKFHSGDK